MENHPLYGHNSVIEDPVASDLVSKLVKLTNLKEGATLLIGNYFN